MKNILFFALLFFSANLAADAVNHYHNDRAHTHPLPAEGVKHKHGAGFVGSDHAPEEESTSEEDTSLDKVPAPKSEVPSDEELADILLSEDGKQVLKECSSFIYSYQYLNCGCVAKTFEQKRSTDKTTHYLNIFNNIISDPKNTCADSERVERSINSFCKEALKIKKFDTPKKRNAYCPCVAKHFTSNFLKKPVIKSRYISSLRVKALTECHK